MPKTCHLSWGRRDWLRNGTEKRKKNTGTRALWRENRGGFPLERQMKGRLRMTATSDSWQVNDGQRQRQRERAQNPWLCLTGKTLSDGESLQPSLSTLSHVLPQMPGTSDCECVCLYWDICKRYQYSGQNSKAFQSLLKNTVLVSLF